MTPVLGPWEATVGPVRALYGHSYTEVNNSSFSSWRLLWLSWVLNQGVKPRQQLDWVEATGANGPGWSRLGLSL